MKVSLRCPITECTFAISKEINHKNLPFGVRLTGGRKFREAGLTGVGVRVGIIDSGIDAKHPGFNGRITKKTWFRTGPLNDHGTHIAGTVHMMAPDADIYDYRVYGREGIDVDEAIAQAITQACDDECNVINLSLCLEGGYINPRIQHQIQDAHEKGVIVVCSSSSKKESTDPLINSTWYVYEITSCSSQPSVIHGILFIDVFYLDGKQPCSNRRNPIPCFH